MRLDRVLLEHERGLAAHSEVVVGAGAGAARPHHAVALAQQGGGQHAAFGCGALEVADAHAAVEAEHQAPVPQRVVGCRGWLAHRGEEGDAVDEAVDGAAPPSTTNGTVLPSMVVVVATSAGGAAGLSSQWKRLSVAER